MRVKFSFRRRPLTSGLALSALAVLGAMSMGCGKSDQQQQAELKAGFEKKGVTLNDVPPEQRERVKAFMQSNKPPTAKTQ